MKLHAPFEITSRLLPGLKVGGATLSLGVLPNEDEGRDVFHWFIDLEDGQEFDGDDLKSGVGGCSLQAAFGSLLAFLGACGEGLRYQTSTGRESENATLFPLPVAEWAAGCSDELACLREEIEAAGATLIEE